MTGPSRTIVVDSTGRAITGDVTIQLRPGIGIVGPTGEHLEGGPHTLPLAFAAPLLHSHRASIVQPTAAPKEEESRVPGAPDGVEHRDPIAATREGRPEGRKR